MHHILLNDSYLSTHVEHPPLNKPLVVVLIDLLLKILKALLMITPDSFEGKRIPLCLFAFRLA